MGCCAIGVIIAEGLREHLKELPYETLSYDGNDCSYISESIPSAG
jgi:hypothetical protein